MQKISRWTVQPFSKKNVSCETIGRFNRSAKKMFHVKQLDGSTVQQNQNEKRKGVDGSTVQQRWKKC
jgi:hypothetical protein